MSTTPPAPSACSVPQPEVVFWFKTYTGLLMFICLTFLVVGVFLFLRAESVALPIHVGWDEETARELNAEGIYPIAKIYIGLGGALAVMFGVALFLNRGKLAWVYDLLLICLTMTSCVCLPMAIPLLIFWIKQDCRDWFMRPVLLK